MPSSWASMREARTGRGCKLYHDLNGSQSPHPLPRHVGITNIWECLQPSNLVEVANVRRLPCAKKKTDSYGKISGHHRTLRWYSMLWWTILVVICSLYVQIYLYNTMCIYIYIYTIVYNFRLYSIYIYIYTYYIYIYIMSIFNVNVIWLCIIAYLRPLNDNIRISISFDHAALAISALACSLQGLQICQGISSRLQTTTRMLLFVFE